LTIFDDSIIDRTSTRDKETEEEGRCDDDVSKEEKTYDDCYDSFDLTCDGCCEGRVDSGAKEDGVIEEESEDRGHEETDDESGISPVGICEDVFDFEDEDEENDDRHAEDVVVEHHFKLTTFSLVFGLTNPDKITSIGETAQKSKSITNETESKITITSNKSTSNHSNNTHSLIGGCLFMCPEIINKNNKNGRNTSKCIVNWNVQKGKSTK